MDLQEKKMKQKNQPQFDLQEEKVMLIWNNIDVPLGDCQGLPSRNEPCNTIFEK